MSTYEAVNGCTDTFPSAPSQAAAVRYSLARGKSMHNYNWLACCWDIGAGCQNKAFGVCAAQELREYKRREQEYARDDILRFGHNFCLKVHKVDDVLYHRIFLYRGIIPLSSLLQHNIFNRPLRSNPHDCFPTRRGNP
jgi:hypothetical protein